MMYVHQYQSILMTFWGRNWFFQEGKEVQNADKTW